MLKHKRLKTVGFLALCLPLCGAWTAAPAEAAEEVYYTGVDVVSTYASSVTSTEILFTSKTIVEDTNTPNNAPRYSSYNLANACGAVAGSIAVGYYDKYYTNMIAGWDSYFSTGSYRSMNETYIKPLQENLYAKMKISEQGVTESNFKSGLDTYISGQGYSVTYEEIGNKSTFNYDKFKSSIDNSEITALFVYPSNIYTLSEGNKKDTLVATYVSSNHIMIAFGYYEVKYTLSTGGTRTDKYLKVSSGLLGQELALYKVGSYLESADIIHIS